MTGKEREMLLVFNAEDKRFERNVEGLRSAVIHDRSYAPRSLNVIVDGAAREAETVHVFPEGWVRIGTVDGETRVRRERVSKVIAFW